MLHALTILVALATTAPSSRPGGEITPPPRRDVAGTRATLPVGELFVPDFAGAEGKLDLVIWFHGAAWCAEQVFYDAHKNAAILVVNAATWKAGFADADAAAFDTLIAVVEKSLHRPVGRICLTSFSGGYTAVRDLLRHAAVIERISDVVLLDSLYAPRIGDKQDRLDPAAMEPFVAFARRAAPAAAADHADKQFFFTQLYPPLEEHRGNTTTLAASYLIDAVGAERKVASGKNSRGTQTLLYRADKHNFHVLGYAGMSNQDHFEHFYSAADVLKLTSLAPAAAK
jgi:hypothetical protein